MPGGQLAWQEHEGLVGISLTTGGLGLPPGAAGSDSLDLSQKHAFQKASFGGHYIGDFCPRGDFQDSIWTLVGKKGLKIWRDLGTPSSEHTIHRRTYLHLKLFILNKFRLMTTFIKIIFNGCIIFKFMTTLTFNQCSLNVEH